MAAKPQLMGASVNTYFSSTRNSDASTAVLNGPRGTNMARPERRRISRKTCDVSTACVVISLVEPILLPVRIRNISQRGLGLLMTTRVAPGSFLAVKVQGPRQKAPRILRARVIHATYSPENRTWMIGCYFVEELRKEELGQLV
jgi:hypothetical protein